MGNCHLKAQLLLFKLGNNVIKSGSEAENANFSTRMAHHITVAIMSFLPRTVWKFQTFTLKILEAKIS